jgi:hypothetical protein
MSDYRNYGSNPTSPAIGYESVVPSDSVNLAFPCRGVYIGGTGNLSLISPNGETVTLVGLIGGQIYPFAATRIRATGTTATDILALR